MRTIDLLDHVIFLPPLHEQEASSPSLNSNSPSSRVPGKAQKGSLPTLERCYLRCFDVHFLERNSDYHLRRPIHRRFQHIRRMRHHEALELRLRPAVHPRADMAPLPASAGRARRAGSGRGRRRWCAVPTFPGAALPLAGLGRARRTDTGRAPIRRTRRDLCLRQ